VFVRDRVSGVTELVSVDSGGVQGNGGSDFPSISPDGRFVSFTSQASNLVPADTNDAFDVFVHDRQSGATDRVSVDSAGVEGNRDSADTSSISADGRFVAFESYATNLVPGDTNGTFDVFVHDRQSGGTERVSVDSAGVEGNDQSGSPSISGDGRFVVFRSPASNLVPGDTNSFPDTFLRDRLANTTERVSIGSGGVEGNLGGDQGSISTDGRYIAFGSLSSNLVPGDTNGVQDIFVRDRQLSTTERVSIDSAGSQADGYCWTLWFAAISPNGRYVAFSSSASNLAPGDTNGQEDIFVRDVLGSPNFTSLCEPGVAAVIACPCSNDPTGLGSGCDNSSATGGAILSASGGTFLSSDSLVFTTTDQIPTSLSILLQGNALAPSGIVYGQGVRCTSGTLKRLFTKTAAAGSITAPDFGAGDPTVSARSAAKGDVIQPGQSRWYLVYYRDPTVLGGCPASSTFNATQTGRVDWSF
jgi:Tol biopolymer transport system component